MARNAAKASAAVSFSDEIFPRINGNMSDRFDLSIAKKKQKLAC